MEITNQAKEFIEQVMKENNASTIRVVFGGMGWGGPKLGLALAEAEETDKLETVNGIQVAIEEVIANEVANLTLDLQEGPSGKGLVMLGAGSDCC